jgi:hypothetical protein
MREQVSSGWRVAMTVSLLVMALFLGGCNGSNGSADTPSPSVVDAQSAPQPAVTAPPDSGPLPRIDANRAFQYTKEVTAFGPRPIGSANHKKLEDYIYAHLKGDDVQDDVFTADTPEGKFPVRNIIAKYSGTKD